MNAETAGTLVVAIGNAVKAALDAQNKLTALEKALESQAPAIHRAYLKELEEIRKNPPRSVSAEGLVNLQQALVQDSR